jgi:glucosamine-6-phosphate deaminase
MEKGKNKLKVLISDSRKSLGYSAAHSVFQKINELLVTEPYLNIIFAAAPSQNEFLSELLNKEIDWAKINAFHMDEYVGLPADAPQRFGNFLKEHLFGKVGFRSVNYMDGNFEDINRECERYSNLLKQFPPHIVCMGIGENAHIAFNDPHVADFNDLKTVKVVDLDRVCRQQQVNDGCFPQLEDVPLYAVTLTIPALISGQYLFCMVPGKNKARALSHTVKSDVTETYPSTLLRYHPNAIIFADKDSSELLNQ